MGKVKESGEAIAQRAMIAKIEGLKFDLSVKTDEYNLLSLENKHLKEKCNIYKRMLDLWEALND